MPNDEPTIPDQELPAYPNGSVGMLMRDRDLARANAAAARDQAERFDALATDADTRADALQVAIDALGGDGDLGQTQTHD